MARTMIMGEDDQIFRAKILKKYRHTPEPFISYEGPYNSAATAQARVTYWANYLADRDYETGEISTDQWAKGEVEVGTVTWGRLES